MEAHAVRGDNTDLLVFHHAMIKNPRLGVVCGTSRAWSRVSVWGSFEPRSDDALVHQYSSDLHRSEGLYAAAHGQLRLETVLGVESLER